MEDQTDSMNSCPELACDPSALGPVGALRANSIFTPSSGKPSQDGGSLDRTERGAHFYWMCDCSSLKELFDYSGDIHQICRIAQELLGYNFTFVHCPARMMREVDSLNRFYDPLIGQYEIGVADRAHADRAARPGPYNAAHFPAFALKCPDTTHAALHTPTSVALLAVNPHVQHDQTQ